MKFTPDKRSSKPAVPYYEDTNGEMTPNYSSTRTPEVVIAMIAEEMSKMGTTIIDVQSGTFNIDGKNRLGYVIRFTLDGSMGEIRIAGLPMRSPTDAKSKKVRAQSLLTVHGMLQSARLSQVFNPDAHPLVPYLLVDETHNVAQAFEQRRLQLLTSGE